MNRIVIAAGLMALALPAEAQTKPSPPAPAGGFTSVGFTPTQAFFVEKPAQPGGIVEVWEVMILKTPKVMDLRDYDMTAARVRINCNAGTRFMLHADGYMGDTHLGRSAGDPAATPPQAGSPGEAIQRIVCGKTDLSKDAPIPDIAEARRISRQRFGS